MRRGSIFRNTNNSTEQQKAEEKPFETHIKNFDAFFDKELAPEIKNLAEMRDELWSKALRESLKTIAIVVLAMLVGMFFLRAGPPILFLLFTAVAATIGIVISNYNKQKQVYNRSFKEQVIRKMIVGIDERLQFKPQLRIDWNEYFKSGIFRQKVDRYDGEDLIETTIDKTKIRFSELHTEEKQETTDRNGNRQTHWVTIFQGVFFIADFNKPFQHQTVVLPDFTESVFGDLIKGFQAKKRAGAKLVNMDDPKFEKNFKVYSTDAIEAHYLLTPNLMERIVKLQEKFDKTIYLSFVESKLHIAISNKNNLFEAPELWGSPDFLKMVKEYHDYLQMCLEIVQDLNLNVRIWGKE